MQLPRMPVITHLHSAKPVTVIPSVILPRSVTLLLAAVCLLLPTLGHAQSTLVIKGVEGRLADNIRILVAKPPEPEQTRQFRRYINGLPAEVITALSAYGYYSAQATVDQAQVDAPAPKKGVGRVVKQVGGALSGKPKNTDSTQAAAVDGDTANQVPAKITQITINVELNAPVLISERKIELTGIDKNNSDFAQILIDVRKQIAPGNVFVSADYESAKSAIASAALEIGYFDFEFTTTTVAVSRRTSSADITIIADPGERFSFGEIQFKQRTFSSTFMNRWVPFKPGEPYEASLIGELTQNLQNSGYFSSVRVRPLNDPRYQQTIPITVDLTERDRNQISVGVGFSTDTKARTKLSWGKPLLNRHGHSAEAGISLSRDLQSASFAYRIPRSKEPLFNYWGIEAGLKNDEIGDTDSSLTTLNFQRVSRTRNLWIESLFLRWQSERFEISGVARTVDLLLPGVSYSRSRSEGSPFPTWGQSVSFQLMGGSKDLFSDIDLIKIDARFRYLRAVSDRNTLIGTVQVGAIESNDFERVPTSERFFAGGDRTVRGFAFREISPRNLDEEAVGGRYLEVLNLEYNYRFLDLWSAALFTDAGRAFNDFSTDYSVGAGVGIRWQSPIGPFRIDIATPISDNENDGDGFRVHLSLGPDL